MTDLTARLSTAIADRYRLERHLGEGGMATVYLAHDRKHDRRVALKVLRPELAAIIGAGRFLQEIKVTANLQHPNILPLYDSGEADSFLYYVMPFVEGETLRDKLTREKQIGVEETVGIAKSVAAALAYAHEQGVVHRDIKPENILLQRGQPLVADFGIALAVSQAGGTRLTETGLSLGTPHYMSPEQATGDRELDARSDLYSLGAVVYEMLTGEPPHSGKTVQAIIAKILTDNPAPIARTRSMVPPNVEAAVLRSLAKSPADRFSTAAQFAEALSNPAFTLAVSGALAPAVPRGRVRWDRLGPGGVGLAVVFLGLAVWALTRPAPTLPVTRVSVALPAGQAFAGTQTFDISLDGSLMVYEGVREAGGSQLWARRWDALEASPIRDTDGASRPAISPDGREVAFARGGGIRIVPLVGGVPRSVGAGDVRCCPRWSPDGAWIYFDHAAVGVGRVPATGGPAEVLVQADAWSGSRANIFLDVLPGGKTVVFEATNASGVTILALDVESRTVKQVSAGQFPRYSSGYLLFATPDGAALMAAPFDVGALSLKGAATPITEGLLPPAGGWSYFAASQTGRMLYGAGSRSASIYEIVWVGRDGQISPIDPEWTFDPGSNNRGLALSPDGRQLAVTILEESNYDIWVKQLPRGPASRLTFDEAQDVRPSWTPDGRAVVFLSDRAGVGGPDVFVKRATGTGAEQAVFDHELSFWEAAYSPDGTWLVARSGGTATVAGGRDIWAIRPGKDSAALPLVVTAFDEKAIAISPDGRWLAYESDETGRNEIYVRPFPEVDDGKWQVSVGGGVMPRWSRSSRELFYVNASNEMVAAELQPGTAFAVGNRRTLFALDPRLMFRHDEQYALYDVAPDDRRFVMFRAVQLQETRPELILVESWVRALKGTKPR